jgi:alanyl-tRNA synthetase
MTDRLYYNDPYSREFEGTVRGVESAAGRAIVRLDRSSFYPTSGGQPFDTGKLDSFDVVDVFEDDDGNVAHVVELVSLQDPLGAAGGATADGAKRPGLEAGQRVRGQVDWPRRFDHMQQHTGQHVLSAAFDRLFRAGTVSFHLGTEASTIDLASELASGDLAKAEEEANRVVWEDRPVTIRYATAEEAERLPLRKEPAREGTLRLIDIDGFDLSACGGTHVARTGAIGIIAVTGWERFKGGQRLEFLCGRRALTRFRSQRDTLAASVRLLSVLPAELPAAIERMQMDAKDQKRAVTGLQTELARYRAEELISSAEPTSRGRLVLRAVDGDANVLKVLASTVISRPGYIVVLASRSTPPLVVIARSADVNLAANEVLAVLTRSFGGRGGGNPDLAQGGSLTASPAEILETARRTITRDS